MQYPICIEWGNDETAYGIRIPDIPNAVTAGNTFEQAYQAAIEVAHIMLKELAELGKPLPVASSVVQLKSNPEFADMGWGFIDIDVTPYLGKTEKINVTLPSYLISKIDSFVKTHNVKSRSTFLANAAYDKLQGSSHHANPDDRFKRDEELTEIESEALYVLMEKLEEKGWGYGVSETLASGAFVGPNEEFDLQITMRTNENQLQWSLTWPSTVGKEKTLHQMKAHTLMWGYELGESDEMTEQNFLHSALESIERITALPRL